jgi:hypothetical protein
MIGVLSLTLPKVAPAIWGKLEAKGEKQALKKRREESLEEKRVNENAAHERTKDKKHKEEKHALHKVP